MHYYRKNIPDFNNATRHLTRVERSLLSDATELYYTTEKPLTSDLERLEKLLLARTDEEKNALKTVLDEFFTLTEAGYFNSRCNEELLNYQTYKANKSKAGKASANKRATAVEQPLNTCSTEGQLTTNYKLTTTNTVSSLRSETVVGVKQKKTAEVAAPEKKPPAPKPQRPYNGEDCLAVFTHWQCVMGHPQSQFIAKRKTLIQKRLDDGYTPTQLKLAVVGHKRSKFHMDRGFDDIEYTLREKNLEHFIRAGGMSNDEFEQRDKTGFDWWDTGF